MSKALYVDPVDVGCEVTGGGMSTILASAIRHASTKFVFVGYTSSRAHPLGRLTTLSVFGQEINAFLLGKIDIRRRCVPDVVKFFMLLRKHDHKLRDIGITNIFTRHYVSLWFFAGKPGYRVCYYAPGLGNPMILGRRPLIGRVLAGTYRRVHAHFIGRAELALAAASRDVIAAENTYLHSRGISQEFEFLPTAVDTNLMYPRDKYECRRTLGLPTGLNLFVYVGRLTRIKGIDFLLDSFCSAARGRNGSLFLIAGQGEEELVLKKRVTDLGISDKVRFLGKVMHRDVPTLIGAADACTVGSLVEGFSLSMVEQVACGRPVVTTDVSGARDLIKNGINGFIVPERNPELFAERMIQALDLETASSYSRELIQRSFTEERLWEEIREKWSALQ